MAAVWMLLAVGAVATGCLGEGRPLEEYLRDQERFNRLADGGLEPTDAGMDFGPEPVRPGCSPYSAQPANLRLINAYTQAEVSYSWVGVDCVEVPYGRLTPGKEVYHATYVGHLWRVREVKGGALVREFRIPVRGEPFTVRVP